MPRRIDLEFKVEGDVELSRRLRITADEIKDFTPEFTKIGDYLTGFFSGPVFESRGGVLGEPWKPRKNEERYTWPILEKTGKMRAGFKSEPTSKQIRVWNVVDYFKFHQSKLPRRKLPRRIMMKLVEPIKVRIVKIFHQGIWERLKKKK